jgi:carbon storage regulator CsrA
MLVLTRKPSEQVRIGDNIVITILKTKGKAVKIGIEAPAEVAVLRGELAASCERSETRAKAEASAQSAAMFASEEDAEPEGRVLFARTGGSRVKTLLPEMLGDSAPLRAMLNRRAAVKC